jgi:hypothetical protein
MYFDDAGNGKKCSFRHTEPTEAERDCPDGINCSGTYADCKGYIKPCHCRHPEGWIHPNNRPKTVVEVDPFMPDNSILRFMSPAAKEQFKEIKASLARPSMA